MKKFLFVLWLLFFVLTIIGAGYVIMNNGEPNAGYACVPMIFSLIFANLYRRKKNCEDNL